MNWEATGAIGEIIGAGAVVLSLLYLAIQIRTQNREARIASVHEVSESFRSAISSFQDPNLAELFTRGRDNFDALTDSERVQFISLIQNNLRVWEDAFHQYQQKRLNRARWNAMVVQLAEYLSLPGVAHVWSIRKKGYTEDFRSFVDSITPTQYRA
jgi:hypothetical protein